MTDGNQRPPLRRLLIASSADEDRVEKLRARFPDLTIDVIKPDDLDREIATAQGVVGRLSDSALQRASELVWVHWPAAGVERLITPALRERAPLVTNSSGVSAPNMAEHIVAMVLAFGRGLPALFRSQTERQWRPDESLDGIFELTDQTVVLAGVGEIGRNIAARIKPFGTRVIGVRRRVTGDSISELDEIYPFERLDEALGQADHVASSLPHTPATEGMFDRSRFEAMKAGAYFYNVGRGKTVVQDDLIAVLESGHLAGAGLDVTDPEPLPEDSPLWGMDNVIITGHTSGRSPRQQERLFALLEENIRRYQSGEELLNVVDLEQGY